MPTKYVPLSDLFPNTHRATLYRWRKAGKLRKPDLIINGREYYDPENELVISEDADEAADRRQTVSSR